MKSEIIVVGAGASGLMAAYSAADMLCRAGSYAQVTLLEKMPRPARKIMISGKGRCNFTNMKDWNEFSAHIRSKSNFVKPAFYNMTSQNVLDFFEGYGMRTVVERGDRAFPASYRASDVVDTLVNACQSKGVKIITEVNVTGVELIEDRFFSKPGAENALVFALHTETGESWYAQRLILATGGLSYPSTGSSGDAYEWACALGHSLVTLFPALTALVPKGYKLVPEELEPAAVPACAREGLRLHIDRSCPLSEYGAKLCGIHLKNVGVQLIVEGSVAGEEFGDIDFTDGGLEGPIGFQLSRKAVKSMVNGSRVSLNLDLKSGVSLTDLTVRIKELWAEIDKDPRSRRLKEKERCRILLGKLMPWELIPAFIASNPGIITLERRSRNETKVWVNLVTIAKSLKSWEMEIAGYVGYERAVVTAGGVDTAELVAKNMESRIVPGLYLCGEVLDIDADTGGYNLQCAFSTGALAGRSAAQSLIG